MDGPDGLGYYWQNLCTRLRFFNKQNFSNSVIIWAGFSAFDTTTLSFLNPRMNSRDYQNVLTSLLLPYIHKFLLILFTFQQDNISIHVS